MEKEVEMWLTRWQDNLIGFHEKEVNPYLIKHLPSLNWKPGAHVLVPLCGKSLDLLYLRNQGFRVTGVEISPIAAESFFKENELQFETSDKGAFKSWKGEGLEILEGNVFDLDKSMIDSIDGIYDRAAMIALRRDAREQYAKVVNSLYHEGISTLLISLEFDDKNFSGPPNSVLESEVHSRFGSEYEIQKLEERDIIDEEEKFREKGLTSLVEKVFHLRAVSSKSL